MAADGHRFVRYFCSMLVHDFLQTYSSVLAGSVRLMLRDGVVGQAWPESHLKLLRNGVVHAERGELRVTALVRMADARDLSAAVEAVGEFYGSDYVRVSSPGGAAAIPLPFDALPFVLWAFVGRSGAGGASDDPGPHRVLEIQLSEAQLRVIFGPPHTTAMWSDETARAADSIDWIADVNAMVKDANGTFHIYTNTNHQMQMVMQWKRGLEGVEPARSTWPTSL